MYIYLEVILNKFMKLLRNMCENCISNNMMFNKLLLYINMQKDEYKFILRNKRITFESN